MISRVPAKYPGFGRRVYPGFLQHYGFVAMNPGHHAKSHWEYFINMMRGDGPGDTDAHRKFYDEYNAVLDLDAAYYLETVQRVFGEFRPPRGVMEVHGEKVAPAAIKDIGLMTVEGGEDDISCPARRTLLTVSVRTFRNRGAITCWWRLRPLRYLLRQPLAQHRLSGNSRFCGEETSGGKVW